MLVSGKSRIYALMGLIALVVIALTASMDDDGPPPHPGNAAAAPAKERRAPRVVGNREDTRMSDWERLAPSLNPEKARALLEKDRMEEKNIALRAERAYQIIAQLCRNGFTREAWDLIDVNEGIVREKSLGAFFHDANLPHPELVGMIDGLQMQERAVSLQGYWGRFAPEVFAQMDLSDLPLRSKNEQGVFRRTIEGMLARIYDPKDPDGSTRLRKDLLGQVAKLMNNGTLEYWHLGDLVKKDPSKDGFVYWETAKSIKSSTRSGQAPYNGTDSQIIRTMTIQDPERMLEMTLVKDTPEAKAMHIAMEQWLVSDYDKAAQWYETNSGKLDEPLQDRAAVAFMRASAKRRNYQDALAWYDALQGETWKSGMKREKQAIEKAMRAGP